VSETLKASRGNEASDSEMLPDALIALLRIEHGAGNKASASKLI
jgi:hypothetical protein